VARNYPEIGEAVLMREIRAVRSLIFVVLVLASPAVAAPVDPVSLYGIVIGERVSVARCLLGETPTGAPCWALAPESIAKLSPPGMQAVELRFPAQGGPSISKYPLMQVMTIDDVVEEIAVFTKGMDVQEEAFRLLVEKFGQPTDQQGPRPSKIASERDSNTSTLVGAPRQSPSDS
jgi:hypothetical protein